MPAGHAYLQNIMTGAVEEFASWGEAFDAQVRRNVREHWTLSMGRPADIAPQSTAPFIIEAIEGPGIGSYERAAHCAAEIGRQQLARLDASLGEIADRTDITRFLQAAE